MSSGSAKADASGNNNNNNNNNNTNTKTDNNSPAPTVDVKADKASKAPKAEKKRGKPSKRDDEDEAGSTLFVGNLPSKVTEGDLRSFFGNSGIAKVRILGKKAFVKFDTVAALEAGLVKNGENLNGNMLKVERDRKVRMEPFRIQALLKPFSF